MNRYVFSYTSKIEHLAEGLITPGEYVVFDVLFHVAGWSAGRPDYARVPKNVTLLHREYFTSKATGKAVWTRQGLAKLIKSLVAKGYLVEEDAWYFLPTYEKWQKQIPEALRNGGSRPKRTATPVAPLADDAQEIATPVANSLVEGTQENATTVAIEGEGSQLQLHPIATTVAEIATPVAISATTVAIDRPESGTASTSPAPSYMIMQSSNIHTPPPPAHARAHEGGFSEDPLVARIVRTLEEYAFVLAPIQVQEIADELDDPPALLRDNPAAWCDWICLAIKEAADNGVRHVRYVSRVIQSSREKQAPPGSARPAEKPARAAAAPRAIGGAEATAEQPAKSWSHAYETARLSYYAKRVASEFPGWNGAKGVENKRLREGAHDADFHRLIRSEAAELARKLAECHPQQRRYYETQHPLAELAAELDEHERGVS